MRFLRNILSRRPALVAVDHASDAVRILGLEGETVRTSITVRTGAGVQGRGWAQELRAAVRAAGLRGAECRVTLPTRLFRMEMAAMPPMSEPERARSARFEAMDRFGIDPDASVIRHAVLGSEGRQVLLMAADVATLSGATEPLMMAGLLPRSIEPLAWASVRGAMAWGRLPAVGRVAFMSLEPEVACLSIVVDGVVESFRCVHGQWGQPTAASITRHAAVEGDIPLDGESDGWRWSALAEEIVRAIRASGGDRAWPERLLLTGPGAEDPALQSTLAGVCGVQVSAAGSHGWVQGGSSRDDQWAAALGSLSIGDDMVARRAA